MGKQYLFINRSVRRNSWPSMEFFFPLYFSVQGLVHMIKVPSRLPPFTEKIFFIHRRVLVSDKVVHPYPVAVILSGKRPYLVIFARPWVWAFLVCLNNGY